jgi:hypothetical protein
MAQANDATNALSDLRFPDPLLHNFLETPYGSAKDVVLSLTLPAPPFMNWTPIPDSTLTTQTTGSSSGSREPSNTHGARRARTSCWEAL